MAPPNFLTLWREAGIEKHRKSMINTFALGMVGGMLLSLAGLTCLIVVGSLGTGGITNAGVLKLVFALIFPAGIYTTIMMGGDLVTSNQGIMIVSCVHRDTPMWAYPLNVSIVTAGNMAGSLLIAGLLGLASGIAYDDAEKSYIVAFAVKKAVTATWGQILVRGIGCNLLVVIAVAQTAGSRNPIDRIVAIWPPIFLFVACSFDHVVANMFFIPFAYFLTPSSYSFGYYLWHSFIPSWIGNAIGAALIVLPLMFAYREPATHDIESGITGSSGTPTSSFEKAN